MNRVRAFIALGSNLGDRDAHLAWARRRLAELPETTVLAVSRVEETAPLGGLDQPPYRNQMLALETALTPDALLAACQEIERERGRVRRERWASRVLDLDLVRFGDRVERRAGLILPHPGIADRGFWQRELAELEGALAGRPILEK